MAFVIPESTWLGHAVRAFITSVFAWLADSIWIVDTEESSISINTSLSSSTSMSHLSALVNVDTTLWSSMVVGGESSASLLVSVALVSSSANAVVFTWRVRVENTVSIIVTVVVEARCLVFPSSDIGVSWKTDVGTWEVDADLARADFWILTFVDVGTSLRSLGRSSIILGGLVVSISKVAVWAQALVASLVSSAWNASRKSVASMSILSANVLWIFKTHESTWEVGTDLSPSASIIIFIALVDVEAERRSSNVDAFPALGTVMSEARLSFWNKWWVGSWEESVWVGRISWIEWTAWLTNDHNWVSVLTSESSGQVEAELVDSAVVVSSHALVLIDTFVSLVSWDGLADESIATWVGLANFERIGFTETSVGSLEVKAVLVRRAIVNVEFTLVAVNAALSTSISDTVNVHSSLFFSVAVVSSGADTGVSSLGTGIRNACSEIITVVVAKAADSKGVSSVDWISAVVAAVGVSADLAKRAGIGWSLALVNVHTATSNWFAASGETRVADAVVSGGSEVVGNARCVRVAEATHASVGSIVEAEEAGVCVEAVLGSSAIVRAVETFVSVDTDSLVRVDLAVLSDSASVVTSSAWVDWNGAWDARVRFVRVGALSASWANAWVQAFVGVHALGSARNAVDLALESSLASESHAWIGGSSSVAMVATDVVVAKLAELAVIQVELAFVKIDTTLWTAFHDLTSSSVGVLFLSVSSESLLAFASISNLVVSNVARGQVVALVLASLARMSNIGIGSTGVATWGVVTVLSFGFAVVHSELTLVNIFAALGSVISESKVSSAVLEVSVSIPSDIAETVVSGLGVVGWEALSVRVADNSVTSSERIVTWLTAVAADSVDALLAVGTDVHEWEDTLVDINATDSVLVEEASWASAESRAEISGESAFSTDTNTDEAIGVGWVAESIWIWVGSISAFEGAFSVDAVFAISAWRRKTLVDINAGCSISIKLETAEAVARIVGL